MKIYQTVLSRHTQIKAFYIRGGEPNADYVEAIDPKNENRKYVETETKIPEKQATIEDYQAKLKELGVQI